MIRISDRAAYLGIAAVSTVLVAFLYWLLLLHHADPAMVPAWVRGLPALNAAFNFSSACLLMAGYVHIRRGNREVHLRFMLAALAATAAFLVSYVCYHHFAGDTRFGGQGWIRPVYFATLVSHVLLSIVNTPLAMAVVFFAATGRFDRHKKLARVTFFIWMFVSLSGVAVYFMIKPYYA